MKIFVVSLDRCVERRKNVEQSLQSLGLEYEIFSAVDGTKLSEKDLALVKNEEQQVLELAGGRKMMVLDKMNNGEIGCALSHLRIYQRILDQGLDRACIIEDDCVFPKRFLEAFHGVDCIKEPWDIINFTHHRGVKSWRFARKYHFGGTPEDYKEQYFQRIGLWNAHLDAIFNARRFSSMTVCYFISNRACKRLIELGYPVRLVADHLTGIVAFNQLRLFKVYPDDNYFVKYNDQGSDIWEKDKRPLHAFVRL